jgi:hypothetical protein
MVAYSYKRRFINPIRVGLGLPPLFQFGPHKLVGDMDAEIRPKRQTIRAFGKRRHARAGEILQHYTAMRTKQCTKIGDARCAGFDDMARFWREEHGPDTFEGAVIRWEAL